MNKKEKRLVCVKLKGKPAKLVRPVNDVMIQVNEWTTKKTMDNSASLKRIDKFINATKVFQIKKKNIQ